MKRLCLCIFLLVNVSTTQSQITWDGEGDGVSWNDAANWVGNTVPTAADDVLLDNSIVSGNYTVTLPSGSVTIKSLTITPTSGDTITLLLPSSNTVTTNAFVTTGSGYSVVINNGGIFINNSGATSGTNLTIQDSMRINNGGRYIHRTRSGHAAWNLRLSRASGTEKGVFEFDVPSPLSYAISTSMNRVYGTLELSANAAGGTKTYTSNAAGVLTVNGDFIINGGVSYQYTPPSAGITFLVKADCIIKNSATLNLCASGANNMTFRIGRDLILNGTITETGSSLTTTVELNGTTNQQILGTGSILDTITFVINNSEGATLHAPLTLPYNLTLTNGRITTTSTNLLTMVDNAIVLGGSSASFVNGPMRKRGNDDFLFPVGKGGIYAPIRISGGANAAPTDEFTAEYHRNNPQTIHGGCPTNCAPGLDHISYVEYWDLDRNNGSASKLVGLTVHPLSFCKVMNNTYVSRWNGTFWTHETTHITSGPTACGSSFQCGEIQTSSPITSFSKFTLATDLPFPQNPLPVKLISFNARKISNGTAHISWELAETCSKHTRFEVQRSADGRNFNSFASVPGNEMLKNYFLTDSNLNKGLTYYRLKVMDVDGSTIYSRVVAIFKDSRGLYNTSVTPNPVQGTCFISLSAAKAGLLQVELYRTDGQRVLQSMVAISEGNNTIPLHIQKLPKGVYLLSAISDNERITYRIVKQ